MDEAAITSFIDKRIETSQSSLLNKLDSLMSNKLSSFQQQINDNNRLLSDAQVAKIEQITSDKYKFNKKGNEEQFRANSKIQQKIMEADALLKEDPNLRDATTEVQEKISEGINLIQQRQKLIKLADSSQLGWLTAEEYSLNALTDDSDDEKKIQRAENAAMRKFKAKTRKFTWRGNRTHPYSLDGGSSTTRTSSSTMSTNYSNKGSFRRPGLCFACGKPGHWRMDCKEMQGKIEVGDKISISNFDLINGVKSSFDSDETHFKDTIISPAGRLRKHIDYWIDMGANSVVLDIIKNGYKIPFHSLPAHVFIPNNKSALNHIKFVEDEIQNLLKKGCISEVYQPPKVINPLTVAVNKAKCRLVLDCRHINPLLYKYKFIYEDANVAKDIFCAGNFVFGFDLKSAYHHIEIFEEHRTYLGFAWHYQTGYRYFVFNVLPFGISVAGYIFTKVTRSLITYWRSLGHKIVMFLDDGIGGDSNYNEALKFSLKVQSDLRKSGFLLADEKCCWTPSNAIVWLGLFWNFIEGKVYITEQRVNKLLSSISLLLERIAENPCIPVRDVACVTGQIIFMHTAVGKLVLLKSRELFKCIINRASWNAPIMVSKEAQLELRFWLNNINTRNGQYIDCFTEFDYKVYSDASSTGYGGFIVENEKYEIFGSWSHLEMSESSTWRELEAVRRILFSCENCLEGQYIQWYTDNKSVVSIIEKGSMKPQLQEKAIDIHNVCEAKNVSINPVWVSRSSNKKADMLSRVTDSEDWCVNNVTFNMLNLAWGPHTFDRFASDYNTKCIKFNSKWWCPGTNGVDAFMHAWANEINWLVPPPRLISRVVDKIVAEKSIGTLVIPFWRSAPYWPKIHDGSVFMPFIKEHRILSCKIVHKGRGNNGIFGDRKSKFSLVALHIIF